LNPPIDTPGNPDETDLASGSLHHFEGGGRQRAIGGIVLDFPRSLLAGRDWEGVVSLREAEAARHGTNLDGVRQRRIPTNHPGRVFRRNADAARSGDPGFVAEKNIHGRLGLRGYRALCSLLPQGQPLARAAAASSRSSSSINKKTLASSNRPCDIVFLLFGLPPTKENPLTELQHDQAR
jgi:hypothetical protein